MAEANGISQHEMEKLVKEVSKEISARSGVVLGEKQYSMVESRLRSHFIKKGVKTVGEFQTLWKGSYEIETEELLSLLTTHHTFFFREFIHFEYLKKILPSLVEKAKSRPDKTIHIWSSACSRGHEVYSLACFFENHLKHIDPTIKYKILGTDVDPASVKYAENGVYPFREVKEIPHTYLQDYWVRGTGNISDYAKIKKGIKQNCEFLPFNLITPGKELAGKKFDLIFCRNVYIYFTQDQIRKSTDTQLNYLEKEGLFIIGISESLHNIYSELDTVGTSVYLRKSEIHAAKPVETAPQGPLKVLCVDDSDSILNLLKVVLGRDLKFKIVGTAKNGLLAQEFLKTNKVDVITLDLHMPEMDGLTFLEKNMGPNLPPVLVVSSVSRENMEVAQKALRLGAKDYVEKPEFSKIELSGEQIRTKLKTIATVNQKTSVSKVDMQFAKVFAIPTPEKMLRVVVGGEYGERLLSQSISRTTANQPPLVCYLGSNFSEVYSRLNPDEKKLVTNDMQQLGLGKIVVRSIYQFKEDWPNLSRSTKISVFMGRSLSAIEINELKLPGKSGQFVFDDGLLNSLIPEDLDRVLRGVPFTSFFSLSEEYFCEKEIKAAA
jgi:chemotaxis protein methyltransferase CheR